MGLFFLKAGSFTFGSGLVIVLIAAPLLARHRGNPNVQGFVKGAYAAAIGTILGACIRLGKIAIGDWLTASIGILSLAILFRWKVSNALLIAATAVVDLIAYPIAARLGHGYTKWVMAMSNPLRAIIAVLAVFTILVSTGASAQSTDKGPLQLEAKILLGDVRGRIDHMAIDLKRQRLFVAELGNDSVGVVDLANRSVVRTIAGLNEPQGVGYEPSTDTLYVANARDGTVKLFDGNAYKATGQIDLGNDADNIRIDSAAKRVVIGYGDGALAFVDPSNHSKVQSAPLKAHPESFQIVEDRIFVNLPNSRAVAVVDGKSGKQIASWPMNKSANFAMAVYRDRKQILVAFRRPPQLAVFATPDGKSVATAETCGDVDDLFVDAKRDRVYVSCGAGYVDVLETSATAYRRMARIPTATGARTSLFVPEMDRLLVAVRAGPAGPAAIWMFKPVP